MNRTACMCNLHFLTHSNIFVTNNATQWWLKHVTGDKMIPINGRHAASLYELLMHFCLFLLNSTHSITPIFTLPITNLIPLTVTMLIETNKPKRHQKQKSYTIVYFVIT